MAIMGECIEAGKFGRSDNTLPGVSSGLLAAYTHKLDLQSQLDSI